LWPELDREAQLNCLAILGLEDIGMKPKLRWMAGLLLLWVTSSLAQAEPGMVSVQVQVAPGKSWTNYPTRTLAALPTEVTNQVDSALSQYGGLLARKE
jgi:hypothetical protein